MSGGREYYGCALIASSLSGRYYARVDQLGDTTILERFLDPIRHCLTPEVARRIADLRADPATQARLDELAEKCNEGHLTDAERREYDAYIRVIDFITILQLKARSVLESQHAA